MFKYRITNADWYNGFIKNRGKITLTIMGYFCVEKFQGLHFLRFRLCFVFCNDTQYLEKHSKQCIFE